MVFKALLNHQRARLSGGGPPPPGHWHLGEFPKKDPKNVCLAPKPQLLPKSLKKGLQTTSTITPKATWIDNARPFKTYWIYNTKSFFPRFWRALRAYFFYTALWTWHFYVFCIFKNLVTGRPHKWPTLAVFWIHSLGSKRVHISIKCLWVCQVTPTDLPGRPNTPKITPKC